MKIVFASSYFNHHQQAISDEFYKIVGNDYKYIETEAISTERKKLGYGIEELPSYVIPYSKFSNKQGYAEILKEIDAADVLILGSAPEKFIKARMKKNLLTFRYSERIYKKGLIHRFSPRAMLNLWKNHTRFKNKKLYMLCASAFTPLDFSFSNAYIDKTFKWGYFPEVKNYKNIEELIDKKEKKSILWAGRIIDWKHNECAIEVANRLKKEGYEFNLKIVGIGDKEQEMQTLAKNYGLEMKLNF
jgi:glycosyltransferase involved in cell wall biosynthesis